jgi:putative transposase
VGGDHDRICHRQSTRKVDDLVRALGVDSGISKSTVSRICEQRDEEVAAFRDRSLDHIEFPYVFVDATYLSGRKDHRVVSRAVVVATGVAADGNREVLDLDVGDPEYGVFWTTFLRRLRKRGLTGVVWPSPTPTPDSKQPYARRFREPHGSGVGSISCATC